MSAMLPLRGVKVIDLSRWISGPHAAMILGDLGADVIKVETPKGDPARLSGPYMNGESTYYMALNRNKRGVQLDLRHTPDMETFKSLLREADVFIENFRPGTLKMMGLDDEELMAINPDLIVISISGYGQTGPKAQRGVFDAVAQSLSGLHAMTGDPRARPMKAGFYVGDYSAGLHAVIGALAGLAARRGDAAGFQHVDISMVESLLSLSATLIPGYFGMGEIPERTGNRNMHAGPADVFDSVDGYVQVIASTDAHFAALCDAIGRPELARDARFCSRDLRAENIEAITDIIAEWCATRRSQDIEELLDDAGIPVAKLATIDEIARDEQLIAREFFVEVEHPVSGTVTLAAPVVRSHGSEPPMRPAPTLGEHTDEVVRDWLRTGETT